MKILGYKPIIPRGWLHELSLLKEFHYIWKEIKRIEKSSKKWKDKDRNKRIEEEYSNLRDLRLYKLYWAVTRVKRRGGVAIK